eukprot:3457770-Rhodomonas_salina.1
MWHRELGRYHSVWVATPEVCEPPNLATVLTTTRSRDLGDSERSPTPPIFSLSIPYSVPVEVDAGERHLASEPLAQPPVALIRP